MTTTRIIDLATQAAPLSTDYVAVDAVVGGTRKMLVSAIQPLLNKLSYYPARAPSGSDDKNAGYSVGSLWLWWQGDYAVGEGAWVCISNDATIASWTRLQPLNKTNGTAAPTNNEDANDGYSVGSLWLWPGHGTWVCVNADTGGFAAWTQLTQPLSDANPSAVGTAGPGTGTDVSRADHVHAHGDQLGGTLHSDAVAATSAGFMSGADKTKLIGIASGATATPLSAATPQGVGTAAAGTGTSASKDDHVHGQVTRDRTTAGNTALVNTTDEILRVSAQADIQLPDPAGKRQFVIKKTGSTSFSINVLRHGSELIEGMAANLELPGSTNLDFPAWMIYAGADGNWYVC
jgi:hypothetical protein